VDAEKTEGIARLHPQNCMECGSCSHICLAGRNLAVRVKKAKADLKTAVTADTGSITVQHETIIS
ncbi:MAG TPA: hypothetical protein VHP30_16540, partial [Ignavibacteriales bacterium]|nr:hypothetical protein [Ignavibacteriales bacterium]